MPAPLSQKFEDVFSVFDNAFRQSIPVLKQTFLLILFITVSQAIIIYLGQGFYRESLNIVFQAIGLFLFLFFAAALLFQTRALIDGETLTSIEAMKSFVPRIIPYFLTLIIALVVIFLYYYLIAYATQAIGGVGMDHASQTKRFFIFAAFGLVPIIVAIVFFIFTLPIIIIENVSPFKAVAESYRFVVSKWIQAFTVYILMGIIVLLTAPTTLHAQFLRHHHVLVLFDFIIYCLTLPFFMCYVLFMLRYLRQRFHEDQDHEDD